MEIFKLKEYFVPTPARQVPMTARRNSTADRPDSITASINSTGGRPNSTPDRYDSTGDRFNSMTYRPFSTTVNCNSVIYSINSTADRYDFDRFGINSTENSITKEPSHAAKHIAVLVPAGGKELVCPRPIRKKKIKNLLPPRSKKERKLVHKITLEKAATVANSGHR